MKVVLKSFLLGLARGFRRSALRHDESDIRYDHLMEVIADQDFSDFSVRRHFQGFIGPNRQDARIGLVITQVECHRSHLVDELESIVLSC